jgi:hypothetical protein
MSKSTRFYVYNRTTGGRYITERVDQTCGKYRWIKDRSEATAFGSRSSASRVARQCGGSVVTR